MATLLIIDGFNVLHAGVLLGRDRAGWWQEPAQRRLIERVGRFADPRYPEIWVVFDRRPGQDQRQGAVVSDDLRIHMVYAPSADDWIVEQVKALCGRARHAGGEILSPRRFLAACG